MKAKEGIIDLLNRILTENLTAINQYFVHGKCVKIGAMGACTIMYASEVLTR